MKHLNRLRNWLSHIYDTCLKFRRQFGAGNFGGADETTAENEQVQTVPPPSSETTVSETNLADTAHVTQSIEPERATTPANDSLITAQEAIAEEPATVAPPQPQEVPGSKTQPEVTIVAEQQVAPTSEFQQTTPPAHESSTVRQKPTAEPTPVTTDPQLEVSHEVPESVLPAEVNAGSVPEPQQAITPPHDLSAVPQRLIAETTSASQPPIVPSPKKISKPGKPQADVKGTSKTSKPQAVKTVKVEVPKEPVAKPASIEPGVAPTISKAGEPDGPDGAGSAIRSARGRYSPGAVNDQNAQRLARLLVSEIKLYNTRKLEGTPNNIYDVLKESIDKARKYYGQRLGTAAIATMPDYFHAELVRSLCGGDASRLGPNYQVSEK